MRGKCRTKQKPLGISMRIQSRCAAAVHTVGRSSIPYLAVCEIKEVSEDTRLPEDPNLLTGCSQ